MYWYVLFVKTGYEERILHEISSLWGIEGLRPFIPMYSSRFKKAGRLISEKHRLFPGYIFLETESRGTEISLRLRPFIARSKNTMKLLRYGKAYEGNQTFEMNKDEQESYLKLYNDDYCVEMSRGFMAGDLVKITEGPLVGFESRIKKINSHRMEAVVENSIMGRMVDIRLGLEIISKLR